MSDLINLWSAQTALSVAIWLVISISLLYFARYPAHQLLNSLGNGLRHSMRLASRAFGHMEKRLTERNREVLLAAARSESERRIDREFTRINTLIARDLARYPDLQRQIGSAIQSIEVTYRESAENPPLPPAWGDVVKMIAALPSHGDPAVEKILLTIKDAVYDTHKETLKTYQTNNAKRHKVLASMQPQWHTLNTRMNDVGHLVESLDQRTHQIDQQMKHYEDIRRGEDSALRSLTSSSLTQFFISGIVLVIALLGGLINFQLIALPMSEMVGGTSYIGALKTSDIAALVIILIEIAMGIFLLESLRITRLFPMISSMDDRMRRRLMIISLTILTILASIEASLAYMRDLLALDNEALQQSLSIAVGATGVATSHAEFRWIPSIGQMIMGFILPFALAFIAIPLESFIHSFRTVLGLLLVGIIRLVNISFRLLGQVSYHTCKLLTHAYDMLIMLPLAIEKMIRKPAKASANETKTDAIESRKNTRNRNDALNNNSALTANV